MKKSSRAFQLNSIQEHVVHATKVGNMWYPCKEEDTELFIRGKGWIKLKGEKSEIGNLPVEWTAKHLQYYYSLGSLAVCEGLLEGWGSYSLYQDGSYGLNYAKAEVANMIRFGKIYDEFTNYVQEIGDKFIANLREGYRIEGGTLWYKDHLICFLDRVHLHPLMHVEHLIKGLVPIRPSFNPISFDRMLVALLVGKDCQENPGKHLNLTHDRVVSVHDRIAYLSNEAIADSIGKIFEMQKVFTTPKE
jgi:hypothetical protein